MEVVARREAASNEHSVTRTLVAGRGYSAHSVLYIECGLAKFTSDHVRTGLEAVRLRCLCHSLHCPILVDASEV